MVQVKELREYIVERLHGGTFSAKNTTRGCELAIERVLQGRLLPVSTTVNVELPLDDIKNLRDLLSAVLKDHETPLHPKPTPQPSPGQFLKDPLKSE